METRQAFDKHAGVYRQVWSQNPLARLQRERLWALIDARLTGSTRLLDAGCGAGDDVEHALHRGHEVVAIDQSVGMLREVAARFPTLDTYEADVRHLDILSDTPLFGAALLNFGVLNCVERPVDVARALAECVEPGAWVFIVWMPRVAFGEVLYFGSRGHLRAAFRRLAGRTNVDVDGVNVPTWFHAYRRVRDDFSSWFDLVQMQSLTAILPPPRQSSAQFGQGALWRRTDDIARRLPGLRVTGDHVAAVFRRRS